MIVIILSNQALKDFMLYISKFICPFWNHISNVRKPSYIKWNLCVYMFTNSSNIDKYCRVFIMRCERASSPEALPTGTQLTKQLW